jgi:hypothetical protein
MREVMAYTAAFVAGAVLSLALCGAVIQALVWVATIALTVVQ